MKCPTCGSPTMVVDSREVERPRKIKVRNTIRRRRNCLNETCKGKFTTWELSEADVRNVDVAKAEIADIQKLRSSIRQLVGGV